MSVLRASDRGKAGVAGKHPIRGAAPCDSVGMEVYLVHHVHHAAWLDGRPTEHRDADGELSWDEQEGDDVKLLGVFSSEERADACVARARVLPGFRDEPDCFLVGPYTVDEEEWTEGYLSEAR